jgi:hypothetical protein
MRLILEIRSGSNAGQEIVLQPGSFARVGRKSQADLAFPGNTAMSGLHFSLECTVEGCWVRDLNSTNGTWVNGQRVSEAALQEGDEIAAGEASFAVHIERDEPTSGATSPQFSAVQSLGSITENVASAETPPSSILSHPILDSPLAPLGERAASVASRLRGSPDSAIVRNDAGHHISVPAPATEPVSVPAAVSETAQIQPGTSEAAAELSPRDRLLELLRKDFQPLYAILDAACSPNIYKFLVEARDEGKNGQEGQGSNGGQPAFRPAGAGTLEGGAQYESLYEGKPKAELVMFAPYLVRLLPESKLLEKLVNRGWGKNWGVYLTCDLDFKEVRRHFRHFLMVRSPDGKLVYFRFYDPRVLRVYLPTCLPEEVNEFFGPIRYFLAEDEEPGALLRFSNAKRGVGRRLFSLAPPQAGGA